MTTPQGYQGANRAPRSETQARVNDQLWQRINNLEARLSRLNNLLAGVPINQLLKATAAINGHTSEMPDTKGVNTDHDQRYVRRTQVASIKSYPSDSVSSLDGTSDAGVSDLYSRGDHKHEDTNRHARQHSITSTSDHTSDATPGELLKADPNGLPVTASASDIESKHTHSKLVASDGSPDPAVNADASGNAIFAANIIVPKTSGNGIQVDTSSPTFAWRDLLGSIETRPAAAGGSQAIPDFVELRTGVWMWRFGTNSPNNHLHEAFVNFHVPHDLVPASDIYLHAHWAQNVVDSGGPAGVPGNIKWYFDISYADGHGTAGGASDPFTAIKTLSVVQQASTTQYGHMIAEVQISNNGGSGGLFDSNTITIDGIFTVRMYRDPADGSDTLNQDVFSPYVDIHYQSTGIGTKNKAPNFYS